MTDFEQIRGRAQGMGGQELVNAGEGAEHSRRQNFRVMVPIERGQAPDHGIGAANRLHRAK